MNHPYINIEMRGRVTRTLFGPVENWHIWRAGPSENQPQAGLEYVRVDINLRSCHMGINHHMIEIN
jgi:hypothetical protein